MLKREYGSVMSFVLQERLKWRDLTVKGDKPFTCPGKRLSWLRRSLLRKLTRWVEDIKILYNDWPYGIDEKIVHLVVWTKFDLEDDPATDDLTPKTRKEIDDFVQKTFCGRVSPDHVSGLSYIRLVDLDIFQVIWFKNWRSLKSIHAVEHFHVMLYDPDPEFVAEITDDDVPLSAKTK